MSEHESKKKKRCPLFHTGGEFNPYKKSHNRRIAVVLFCGRVLSEGDSSCTQVLRFDPVVVLAAQPLCSRAVRPAGGKVTSFKSSSVH